MNLTAEKLSSATIEPASSNQVREWKEGIQADGSYIAKISPSDVGKARWSKEIDPADIWRAALRKAAVGTGIANNEAEAKQIVDNMTVNGLTTQTNKGTRFVEKSDVGFGAWVKQRTDRQGRWAVQAGADDIALMRESARQLKIGNPDVAIALPSDAKQQADAGVLAGGALALPKLAKELPKAAVIAGEAAPPLLVMTGGVLGTAALVHQHVGVLKSNWEDALKATRMPLPMTMDDAEPQPQPIPDAKPKDQPYAEPQAKPKVTDLPNAPADIIPVPQAKPERTIEDLPQPITPDVPKGTPPQSPKNIDPRLVPPTIIGGTALAKVTIDKLSEGEKAELQKAGHIMPSLSPDPNRMPEGTPEKAILNPTRPDEIRQNEDIELQNSSAEALSKAGYEVKQRHNTSISVEEAKNNPLLKVGKQPDYEIEGQIFDHVAPQKETSVRNLVTRSIKRDKIDKGQATRFVVNLDKSQITFDQLQEQLKNYPVEELEEIIVIKNGEITPFYPFK